MLTYLLMFMGLVVMELDGRDLATLMVLKHSFFSPSFGGRFISFGGLGMCGGKAVKYPKIPHLVGFEYLNRF